MSEQPSNTMKFEYVINIGVTKSSSGTNAKRFFINTPRTPKTPGGTVIDVIGSSPKEKSTLILQPVSASQLHVRRKMHEKMAHTLKIT
jgi:hypothetical protein